MPNKELAKLFVLYGADPTELSFLHCFFSIRPNFDYLAFLIQDLGLDIEEFDVNGISALGHVYEEQNYEQLSFLVENGADINKQMLENGRTLLMDAALRGNSGMFEFLLKQGADQEMKCHTGRTVEEYVKMEYIGKPEFTVIEMGQMLYRHRLMKQVQKRKSQI